MNETTVYVSTRQFLPLICQYKNKKPFKNLPNLKELNPCVVTQI
jgi:hypothetical protein